jgi:hypothetical protein
MLPLNGPVDSRLLLLVAKPISGMAPISMYPVIKRNFFLFFSDVHLLCLRIGWYPAPLLLISHASLMLSKV